MRYCLIADTHFGVNNNERAFHDSNERFFSEIFFPLLKKVKIDRVVHLGDVYHNRQSLNWYSAERSRKYFFEPLRDYPVDVIAGNHDLYFKHTSSTSSLNEIVKFYDNIRVFDQATEVNDILYIPWINKENKQHSFETIAQSKCKTAFGHLELTGYKVNAGSVMTHGYDPTSLAHFEHVYTGHFHMNHTIGNVTYIGSVQQHSWADVFNHHGIHMFDTDTRKAKMIINPYSMYRYIDFGEHVDQQSIDGHHIRVRYNAETKRTDLQKYIKKIAEFNPLSITTVDNKVETSSTQIGDQAKLETTIDFIHTVDEQPVRDKLLQLYDAARQISPWQ